MESTGDLVGVVVEFTAGVQHGHDDLRGGPAFFGVEVHGDTASVIADRDRFVGVDSYGNRIAVTGQGLVNRVVDNLEDHMVQACPIVGVADVHARAFSDRLEAL